MFQACGEYSDLKKATNEIMENRNDIHQFLCPGRLLLLDSSALWTGDGCENRHLIPAVVLSVVRQTVGTDKYKVKVLTHDSPNAATDNDSAADRKTVPLPTASVVVPVRPLADEIVYRKVIAR